MKELVKDVLAGKAVRGMYGGSDHYVVLTKIKIKVDGSMTEKRGRGGG